MPEDDERKMEPNDRDRDSLFRRRVTDLERTEMLAVALAAFAQPIPDYEPRLSPQAARLLQPRKT